MFRDNLIHLRKLRQMTQEDVAFELDVARQTVAKWEAGESVPDLDKCRMLADLFGVYLDDLANYEPGDHLGLSLPPKGKHLFGLVTVGDKGQIVIPAKARKVFDISPGDQLEGLRDESQGLALMKYDHFLAMSEMIMKMKQGKE